MFDMLCLLGCSFLLLSFLFTAFWYKFLVLISAKFPDPRGFFRCCLLTSHMSFWVLYVTSGLHLIVNPLYLHFRRHILIEDIYNDTSAYSGDFLPSLFQCCKEGFLHQGKDSDIIHLSCLPRTFDVVELTRAFFLSKNAPQHWFGHW